MLGMILALALVMGAAAPSAEQFDLICKGQQRLVPSHRWKPYEVRYRVDLAKMVYCRFECHSTETIAKVDPARITFQVPANGLPASFVAHYIDRTDGRWTYFLGSDSEAQGVCEPAPFSGLPAAKF